MKFEKMEDMKNYILTLKDRNFDELLNCQIILQGWYFEKLSNKLIERKRNIYIWETTFYNSQIQTSLSITCTTKHNKKDDVFTIVRVDKLEDY